VILFFGVNGDFKRYCSQMGYGTHKNKRISNLNHPSAARDN
jgi:hypothetical protein